MGGIISPKQKKVDKKSEEAKNISTASETEENTKVGVQELRWLDKWANAQMKYVEFHEMNERLAISLDDMKNGKFPPEDSKKPRTIEAVQKLMKKVEAALTKEEKAIEEAKNKLRVIQADRWDPEQDLQLFEKIE